MSELVGQIILGRYRVEHFIGRGGMAEVYKVWDAQRVTHLAMKLLREDLALDKVFLRRFKREAQTLARLQHPNIVRFYGLEQEDRLAFMLIDFIEGESLKHEIFDARGPFSYDRLLAIMRPVCSALTFAHNQGMVHCDMKPGNILIDRTGRVLVSDFGIARMMDAATATMVGAGTPAYMAPEQARGEDPTPQTDIYALGIMLFEMLTGGERPFTGEHSTATGSTSEKVRWEQLHLKPPSPRQYNPGLAPELEQVVLTCLAKDPAGRFANPIDLLNALEQAAAAHEPAAPHTPAAPPAPVMIVDDPEAAAADEALLVIEEEDKPPIEADELILIEDEAEGAFTPGELVIIEDSVEEASPPHEELLIIEDIVEGGDSTDDVIILTDEAGEVRMEENSGLIIIEDDEFLPDDDNVIIIHDMEE